jgi:signal transduction histidine kinase
VQLLLQELEEVFTISVKDEGQGMDKKDQKLLFQKFARLSSTPTAGEDSTGLGLAIVKRLIEALNGTIRCISEKGVGTEFIISLPKEVKSR